MDISKYVCVYSVYTYVCIDNFTLPAINVVIFVLDYCIAIQLN